MSSNSNSIFSSVESERRWVVEVDKNFDTENIVDIDLDNATCVFRVPKSLSETKPEAYAPRHLGLGPYHHVRPEFYVKQKQKLSAVKNFLGKEKLQSFNNVVESLTQWECVIRACYDNYLDFDIATLARILAIDAIYLVQLLDPEAVEESTGDAVIVSSNKIPIIWIGDIMMVENQIPFILLKKTLEILQLKEEVVMRKFQNFCEDYSPLELNQQSQIVKDLTQPHLLHRMYYLIVTNRGIKDMAMNEAAMFRMQELTISISDVSQGVQFLADQGMPGAGLAGQILSFMENVPWHRILALFKKGGSAEESPSVEEIDIPTVSRMSEVAGIKFKCTTGGVRDIKYDDNQGEENVFYLPRIRVDTNTEVILRNLVAYEAAIAKPGSILELAEYVDLMCGIVDTPKDVKILKTEGIVESELPDEEIARVFNGIGKSTKETKEKSDVQVAIDNVNQSYHNVWSVKVKEFLKKYGYASLKFLGVLITIAVLVLIILNAFCSVLIDLDTSKLFNVVAGLNFNIDEIVQAWNEIYEAKKWQKNISSFRLEPVLRRRVSKLYYALECA